MDHFMSKSAFSNPGVHLATMVLTTTGIVLGLVFYSIFFRSMDRSKIAIVPARVPLNPVDLFYFYQSPRRDPSEPPPPPLPAGITPYQLMNLLFEGHPEEKDLAPLMRVVTERYKLPHNDEVIGEVGNMLIQLKKWNQVGATEMDNTEAYRSVWR